MFVICTKYTIIFVPMKTMTNKQFIAFQEKHGLTVEKMASLLMLSKESVYKRRTGKKKVSVRDIALMTRIKK